MATVDADTLDRIQKLAIDTGEAATPEDAAKIFAGYRLQLDVGSDGLVGAAAEAAFATIINSAPRAFQGGVRVRLADDPKLKCGWVAGLQASEAVVRYGCELVSSLSDTYPTLVLGSTKGNWPTKGICLGVVHVGWAGGVTTDPDMPRTHAVDFPPAGVLAGAVAVAEAFQSIRGNVRAGRRDNGLSLWRPDIPWLDPSGSGPDTAGLLAPNKLSVLGLGHLGQAYLWTLGWLPYPNPKAVEFVLQDVDFLCEGNLATSLLATRSDLGKRKTRLVAAALERRGFQTRLIERRFNDTQRVDEDDPQIALIGVDNPSTRSLLGNAGWKQVVDVGLGAGAGDYLDASLHTFPAPRSPSDLWGGRAGSFDETLLDLPAYQALERRIGDRCGMIMVAGRAVGAAFVGAFASSIAVAEILRYYADDQRRFEVIDVSLRDLSRPRLATAATWAGGENLGFVEL
jgi:hypothetical protein